MNIHKKLNILLLAVFMVFMGGSAGYYLLFGGKYEFIDCLYMTVISLTSVGYGEILQITGNVPAQIFTMILLIFGMSAILYGLSTLTAIIIEGELTGILRKNRMEKQINKLNGHYIVCGGGETGYPLIAELTKNHEHVVLVEMEQGHIDRCESIEGLLYIKGDATEDQNLIAAGIKKAKGIIVNLPSDKDTLYVTMSARMLNKTIRIISRMVNPKLEEKLKKAGADSVVSPNFIGAMRMASEMIRPTVVDFLDSMLRSTRGNLRIHEITVSGESGLAGKKIGESGLKDKFDLLILGYKRDSEEMHFNPPPAQTLEKGMTLIVMGEMGNIDRAREAFSHS